MDDQIKEELMLKMDSSIPYPFRWAMASSASTASTIGEKVQCRSSHWLSFVCVPPLFIAGYAGGASIAYGRQSAALGPDGGFPWWLPVVMLSGTYPAVVFLAMDHLILFSPEAPFAAWEALANVGYKRIGFVVAFTSGFSLLLADHPWVLIAWACLLLALMAAVVAFWLCIARTYSAKRRAAAMV